MPSCAEILDVGHVVRLERRLVDQEFDRDALAVGQHAPAVLDREAGLLKDGGGLTQQVAILAGTVGDRRNERLAEHFVRHLAAERLEQRELVGARLAGRHHVGILEHRMGAVVRPIHDRLVGPLEIERQDQRFAQQPVLEFLAAGVEEPALRAGRRVVGKDVLLDAAVLDRRKIVARRPDARGELLAEEIVAAGKSFERHVAVAIEFVAKGGEVVVPDRYRQIGAPPIRNAIVFDETAGLELADLVGAGAERDVERRFVETTLCVIGARKDRQLSPRTTARRGHGPCANRTTTVASSAASAPVMSRVSWTMIGCPFSLRRLRVKATSCAVIRLPSWNFASGRIEKR